MTTIETRRYEMLVRVREFGEAHKALFPESSVGGRAFAAIAAAVEQLSGHAASKMSLAQEGRTARTHAREALVDRLITIAQAAKLVAQETPGFADWFQPPRRKQPDQTLLTTGRVYIQNAGPEKSRFLAAGMPETFIADLTKLVDQFGAALLEREAGWDGQARAKAGITAALSSGTTAARKLDIVIASRFGGDPVTMAVWERDRRVEQTARRRRAAPAPSSEVPPPVSTPTGQPAPLAPAPVAAPAVATAGTPAPVATSAPAPASAMVPISTPAAASAPAVELGQPGEADVPLKVAS